MITYNDYLAKAKQLEDSYDNKLVEYKGAMSSAIFNENFKFIKRKLDDLYEKTRIIQNISEYTRSFLRTQVITQKESLYELLKAAEKTRDSLKKDGYKTKTVLFAEDLKAKRIDRDGIEVAPASVMHRKVTLLGKEEEIVPIKNLTIQRGATLTASNNKDILKGEPVRNMYMLDYIPSGGVTETYKLEFEKESYVTSIEIENVNSDISNINLTTPMNRKIQIPEHTAIGFKKQLATEAEVSITDKSYRQVMYEYDATRMSSDFWHKVAQKEYAQEMGLSYSFDLEGESGLRKYKEDYATYKSALASWQAEKAATEARNEDRRKNYESTYNNWNSQYEGYTSSGSGNSDPYGSSSSNTGGKVIPILYDYVNGPIRVV